MYLDCPCYKIKSELEFESDKSLVKIIIQIFAAKKKSQDKTKQFYLRDVST